jgi:aldehyde dehydrogenase (NAD+)
MVTEIKSDTRADQAGLRRNYIGGAWTGGEGATFESRNPARVSELLGTFPVSSASDVNDAVRSAREAYRTWSRVSRIKRAECFDNLAQIMKARTDELARLVSRECGKALNEGRADVVEAIHMVQFVFGSARFPMGDILASEVADKDAFMRRKPKGVVAAITPWNFPMAIPTWLLGPSLVEGNTVVFKPSEDTPLTGHVLVEMMEEAGFPPGTINLVHGDGSTGAALVEHPDVDVVLFTGSYETGAKIKQVCAADWRKMVACEMGSKSAVIVMEDALYDIATTSILLSAFKTAGQRCVSGGRAIVHESLMDRLTNDIADMASRMRIGDPLDEQNFMGPVINQQAVDKISYYNQLARDEGAEVLLDGGRLSGPGYDDGYFMGPFVCRETWSPDKRALREEVFGPHLAIIPFRTVDEAIEIYNATDYGLSCAVITEDFRKAREVRDRCDYGLGYVNLPCIGAEVHLPFGGVKKSGTGLPSASTLIDVVTHRTAWTVNYGTEVVMAQGLSTKV